MDDRGKVEWKENTGLKNSWFYASIAIRAQEWSSWPDLLFSHLIVIY